MRIMLSALWIYSRSIFHQLPKGKNAKVIYLDVVKPEIYSRYFYILAKYFFITGYEVFLKRSLRSIYYMSSDVDTSFIFKERGFHLGNPLNLPLEFRITDSILNSNYFDFLIDGGLLANAYHVPIGFHPYIYFKEYWRSTIETKPRFKSLFMAGNFSKDYSNDYNERFFGVTNRYQLKQNIEILGLLEEVESADLDQFEKGLKDSAVYIVDRKKGVPIPPKVIFELLGRFDFFFAFPGLYMPLCHNVVEAMAVGTIPFLQQGYAKSFRPELTNGINCITFIDLKDLKERIKFILSLDKETIANLRSGVNSYFDENFSSESVVSKILSRNYTCLYLMAEKYSVDQMALKVRKQV